MNYNTLWRPYCLILFTFVLSPLSLMAQDDFSLLETSTAGTASSSKVASRLKIVPSLQAHLMDNTLSDLNLTLPLSERNDELRMVLQEVPLFPSEGLRVSSRQGSELITEPGKIYKGQIMDDPDSRVHLALYDDDLHLRVMRSDGSGYKLFRDQNSTDGGLAVYELYEKSSDRAAINFVCGNVQNGHQLKPKGGGSSPKRLAGTGGQGPLRVYLEIDYATFVSLGGTVEQTINAVTTLFAAATSHFDQINCNMNDGSQYCVTMQLAEIFIHTTPDGYPDPGGSVFRRLEDFVLTSNDMTTTHSELMADNDPSNDPDLFQLINWSDVADQNGGVSNGIGNLCGGTFNPLDNNGNPLFLNGPLQMNGESIALLGPVETVPNGGQSDLYAEIIIAHELGHSMGARHTGANAFYSSDDTDCPGHRYALELASCGAEDNTLCNPTQGQQDPPRAEPNGRNIMGNTTIPGRTVYRLCPTRVMSSCWAFENPAVTFNDVNDNVVIANPCNVQADPDDGLVPDFNLNNPQMPLMLHNMSFHEENVDLMCAHLNECDTWGGPVCTAPETADCNCGPPGNLWLDTDCDGIPDCCECDTYVSVPNEIMNDQETIGFDCMTGQVQVNNFEFVQCDDNDPCTSNDRIRLDQGPLSACNCAGTPMESNVKDDDPGGGCIDNTDPCVLLEKTYAGDSGAGLALSQYPVAWTSSSPPANPPNITTPDILANWQGGNARIVKRKAVNGNNMLHEGIVVPLCCPLMAGPKARTYTLSFDAAFLGYYDNSQATVLIQSSNGPPSVHAPLSFEPNNQINGYETLSQTVALGNSLPPAGLDYPVLNGNTDFNDFWFQNGINIPFTMSRFTVTITPDQFTDFLYFSINTNCPQLNPGETIINNIGGGGSFIIDNITVTQPEPPITLVQQTEEFEFCEGFRTEIIQQVLDSDLASNNCEFMICEGEDFKLEVVAPGWTEDRPVTLAEPPFCFTENNYRWERLTNDLGGEPCPPEIQTGSTFCLEDFDEMMQGRYLLTLFDPACNCENEMEFELRLDKKPDMELAYQLCYVECLMDQADDTGQFTTGCSSFIKYDQPTGPDCALHLCMDDYWSRTLQVRPTDPQMPLDLQDIVILFYENIFDCRGIGLPEGDEPLDIVNLTKPTDCWENRTSISFDGFGTYMVYDRHCPSNPLVFVVEPDDMIDLDEVMVVSEEPLSGTDCEVKVCFIYFDQVPEAENHQVVQWNDGSGWSSNRSTSNDNDTWCTTLPMNEDHLIQIRWGDDPSCCEEFMYRYDNEQDVKINVDNQLCDANNGGVEILDPDPHWTFMWSNGSTESFIDCLGVGEYTVTVTDEYGCTSEHTRIVNQETRTVITTSGGVIGLRDNNEAIARTGIKLTAGSTLNWLFETYHISDNFRLEASPVPFPPNAPSGFGQTLLYTTPVTSYVSQCCLAQPPTPLHNPNCTYSQNQQPCNLTTNDQYCGCGSIFLGDYQDNSIIDFSTHVFNGEAGVNSGIVNLGNSTRCKSSNNFLTGTFTVPHNVQGFMWVRAIIDGQPCDPNGSGTVWKLIISCTQGGLQNEISKRLRALDEGEK